MTLTNRQLLAVMLAACVSLLPGIWAPQSASAQSGTVGVNSIDDITADGSAHALGSSSVVARMVIIQCASANSAVIYIGGSGVGSTNGLKCAAGGVLNLTPLSPSERYQLSRIYQQGTSGDKLSVITVN